MKTWCAGFNYNLTTGTCEQLKGNSSNNDLVCDSQWLYYERVWNYKWNLYTKIICIVIDNFLKIFCFNTCYSIVNEYLFYINLLHPWAVNRAFNSFSGNSFSNSCYISREPILALARMTSNGGGQRVNKEVVHTRGTNLEPPGCVPTPHYNWR